MTIHFKKYIVAASLLIFLGGCKVDPILDPNNPNATAIGANASLSELQNLADGSEGGMRESLTYYYDDLNAIGREYYRFSTSDPRFTSDLLGKSNAVLDNNTFYLTNPYAARYRVVRNTNILIDALTNTKAPITEAQRKAGIGYAKTIQAYQLLSVLNLLYNNGIRVDVKDPDKLGAFLNLQQSLDAIIGLLNDGNTDLKNNNVDLPFTTSLFSRNAAQFSKFNRALAARVAIYKQDWATANTALAESFMDINGDLNTGVFHLFSAAGGDQLNPVFFPRNSNGETRVAHPAFIRDAEAGDTRLSKVAIRTAVAFQDDLQSNYDFNLYKTNVDPIAIIRNEELILIYAEVKAQATVTTADALIAINRIRKAAGLLNYAGATDKASLITEILKQRRYSLFGEGHRWIDLRRNGLLAQLPIDRVGDDVWVQFPKPANE